MLSALYAIVNPPVCLSVCPSHGWISRKRWNLGSYNFHHTVAPSLSCLQYKFHPEIPTGSPRAGASNEGGLGKRANIVGVLTLSPGGRLAAQVRRSIAAEESKFKINRQVADLSRANPGVSSVFLFRSGNGSPSATNVVVVIRFSIC